MGARLGACEQIGSQAVCGRGILAGMVGMLQLLLIAVRGPWRLGSLGAVVVAVTLALLGPALGWSVGSGLAAGFFVIFAAAIIFGYVP